MELFVFVLDFLCTLNEAYWLYKWTDFIYEKKAFISKKHTVRVLLCPCLIALYLFLALSLNRIALTSPYTIMVLLIVSLISVVLFWKCDFLQAVDVVGLYFLLLFVKGNIEISIMGFIGGKNLVEQACFEISIPRALMILLSMVFLYAINYGMLMFVRKKQIYEQISQNMAVMTALGLASSFLFGKVFIDGFRIEMGILWYMFITLALLLLYIMYYTMKSQQIRFRVHTLELQNTILAKYYVQVDEAYKRKSKLYHEMNHHLQAIYHFLESGDSQKAAKYIEDVGCIGEGYKNIVFTGINLIDAIFNDYTEIAANKGIVMTIKAQMLPIDIGFANSDMCSLLSNLLENATEAAKTYVSVKMNRVEKTLYLKIVNDFCYAPVVEKKHFLSLKKDSELHGWGTQIIEDIVRKYEGDFEYDLSDNFFRVSIMINEKD